MSETTSLTLKSSREDLKNLQALLDRRELLPLLPLIYVAWANGELTAPELQTLQEIANEQKWLPEDACEVLSHWLDPEEPPTPVEMRYLLDAIQKASEPLKDNARQDLATLGSEMASFYSLEAQNGEATPEQVEKALFRLQQALGVVGSEAARSLYGRKEQTLQPEYTPTFDTKKMKYLLDGSHHELRDEVRTLLASDRFRYSYDLPLSEFRDLVMTWMGHLAEAKIGERSIPIPEEGKAPDMGEFLAIFETLGIFDLSLLVKFGVQYGLFGGSILFLGTREHHEKYLLDTARLDLLGCYAMTEMGRGSNVRELETRAVYDPETDEFIVHTPRESARKEWIGNAGKYATMATVYAQLIVPEPNSDLEEEHGVHAFLVPLRDENGEPLPGVRLEDQGPKMGLNGVDNGRIWFDNVRIPSENLLNRYGTITEDGRYESSIPSANRRFFTTLSTLVAGRLGVTAGGLSAGRTALAIAIRYSANRRQFGPAGAEEIPILEYRMQQRSLLPKIASAYAQTFGLHELMDQYNDPDFKDRRQVEAMAAGMKAYSSWFAIDAVQASREACGGQGYLTINRLPEIRKDVDVFATFEGANVVMLQQVAKACLSEFSREMADGSFFSMARMLANQATRTLTETNLVVVRNTSREHLLDSEFQLNAFTYRENNLRISLARRLKKRIDEGMDSFLAFNDCQDHAIALALAHIESFLLRSFIKKEADVEDEEIKSVLGRVRSLFALTRMEEDLAWFLENGYVQTAKARAVRDLINALCAEVKEDALSLVESFGIPDEVLSAPIAFANGKDPGDAQNAHALGVVYSS